MSFATYHQKPFFQPPELLGHSRRLRWAGETQGCPLMTLSPASQCSTANQNYLVITVLQVTQTISSNYSSSLFLRNTCKKVYFSSNEETVENVCGDFNITKFTEERMVFTLHKSLLYKKRKEKKKDKATSFMKQQALLFAEMNFILSVHYNQRILGE